MCEMCPMSKKDLYETYKRELRMMPRLEKDLERRRAVAVAIVSAYEKEHKE